MPVYAGLYKISCDMCGDLVRPSYTITHKDNTKADICAVCYGKCLMHPKFNQGIEDKDITVREY